MKEIDTLLLKYWGYNQFKDSQKYVINSIINGENALVSLPTGGGKSICFQLPSLIIGGTTLVVSPLVALMEDQVKNLIRRGISSFYFKSNTKHLTIDQQLDNCINGNYNIIYCSPERFGNNDFLNKIQSAKISHIAVDEAHCISEWGHEFRPSYRNIKKFTDLFPKASISAYSGSANPTVRKDIVRNLGLIKYNVIEASYERKNIFYEIKYVEDKIEELFKIIKNESCIIYCKTRKSTEFISRKLSEEQYSVDYFHGGMSDEDKKDKLSKWQSEDIKIIVATTAFGMGIDKSDVNKVIHLDIPESIENYYQESGRVGRGGQNSKAILIVSHEDKNLFIKNSLNNLPNKVELAQVYKKLCSHFQIPIGEGQGSSFDFDLNDFCTKYKFNKRKTYNIIRFLENNDIIILKTILRNKIKISLRVSVNKIRESIQVETPQGKVIESLLRLYPNIIQEKIEFSISKMKQLTNLKEKDINQYLNFYTKMNFLNIEEIKSDHQIYWLKPREDKYTINPLIPKLNKINSIKKIKYEDVLNYIFDNKNCKTRQLLKYFGENKTENCMNCSSLCCK